MPDRLLPLADDRCLLLTQPQVTAARGDRATRVPAALDRPAAWA